MWFTTETSKFDRFFTFFSPFEVIWHAFVHHVHTRVSAFVCLHVTAAKWLGASPPPHYQVRSLSDVIIRRVALHSFVFYERSISSSKASCPTRYLFLCSPSLAASRHLQSKDEICVEFIKGYSADCKKKKKLCFSLLSHPLHLLFESIPEIFQQHDTQ